jgi:hypothetical protein
LVAHSGHTPLHRAADAGNETLITMLLAARAEINAKTTDPQGYTALDFAIQRHHKGAIALLAAKGGVVSRQRMPTSFKGHLSRTYVQKRAGTMSLSAKLVFSPWPDALVPAMQLWPRLLLPARLPARPPRLARRVRTGDSDRALCL